MGRKVACIQETERKLVSENASDNRLDIRGELGKEKGCINMTQDQENLNK